MDKEFEDIKLLRNKWEENNKDLFKNERKDSFVSETGIPIKRVYSPIDLEEKDFSYENDLGFPGEYPFTRGMDPLMYRGPLYGIVQYSGLATPEETNILWKNLIAKGQTTLSVAYDLPTQLGYDPDYPMADGEVCKVGVPLRSLKEWEIAFDGIDLRKVFTYTVCNAPAAITVALHFTMAEKQGVNLTELTGGSQNDILKEYISRGNFIFPPKPAMRLIADTIIYCSQHVPKFKPIGICSYHLAEMGANRVHEAAYAIANGIAYLEAVLKRGVDIDSFAPVISWNISHDHRGFFEEIAKVRAMRKIWARTIKERFKAKDPKSMLFNAYSGSLGTSMVKEQYLNNIARGALAALAGALAGLQRIEIRTMDEVLGIPTEEAELIAVRCQQVVAYETGIADTIDPLGGSYYLEYLTKEFEDRIIEEIARIDEMGGMVKAIETGYVQKQILEDAYKYQREIESGERVRVGFNKFYMPEEKISRKAYRADPNVEEMEIERVKATRSNRNNKKVVSILNKIKEVAQKEESNENNLMPYFIEAVREYTTIGEICNVLREVFGEYDESRKF